MKIKQAVIGILVAIIAALGGGYYVSNPVGSIQDGQAYNATTTYNLGGAPTFGVAQVLKTSGGTFGSVVITGAVAGAMKFYDATSTTDVASTTIATFPASAAAGTYTLDSAFNRGLIMGTVTGLTPTTTITWR